jgi:DTW domain-containing protein YfiP
MSTRRSTKVKRCPECKINQQFCFCSSFVQLKSQHAISVVIHVRELKLTSNTAYFIQKLIPDSTQLVTRGRVNLPFDAKAVVDSSPLKPIYVYPDEEAVLFDEHFMADNPGPYHFIIPDGSWTQARKVHKREEAFTKLTKIKLPENLTGEYLLRKAQHRHWLSTFEAIAHCLKVAGEESNYQEMMKFFRVFNQRVHLTRNLFSDSAHTQKSP